MNSLSIARLENSHYEVNRQETDNDMFNVAYGRTERDIRHRRSITLNFVSLKEAKTMILEFDGTSRHKLQKFLNACTYAVQNISPADEESLIQTIHKIKGKSDAGF